jgi:hypothetical protein
MGEHDFPAEQFEENRTNLRAVAYRMLGSLSEADDAVQQVWLRLHRSDAPSHTSGAVNPPRDWATTTRSVRSPIAPTTASAYSDSPAESSPAGRSTATASWPRSRSSGTSRCRYQATPPAPGINT